jgi:ectoine hydroxylase-related dioxygenase (phytanoyl-CoA dioxygenase family)
MVNEGYVLLEDILDANSIKELDEKLSLIGDGNQFEGLSEPGVGISMIREVEKIFDFKKINIQKILEAANEITGNEMVIWNIKANLKSRWHGSCEYYHQDAEYWEEWGVNSNQGATAILFIDQHSHENGGLWVIPKTHMKRYVHEVFLNINSLQKRLIPTPILDELVKSNKPIQINGKKGGAVVFHSCLVHGSSHNISGMNRKTVLIQMCDKNVFKNVKKKDLTEIFKGRRAWEINELNKRIESKKCK